MTVPYRCVAMGDSITEGVGDPDGDGLRGWADRLAGRLAPALPDLRYENIAVRGKLTGQVRAEQLEVARSLHPDLVAVTFGMNDLIRGRVDLVRYRADAEAILGGFPNATVVTSTLPDMSRVLPWAGALRRKVAAMNVITRDVAGACGTVLLDAEADEATTDAALWSPDRLHLNAHGHQLFADRVAALLGWPEPEGAAALAHRPVAQGRLGEELTWAGQLAPWLWRRLRRRGLRGLRAARRSISQCT